MRKSFSYLNPITHLGEKKYSTRFPVLATLGLALLSEFYLYVVIRKPETVGIYAIFVFLAAIIYFSFRNGIRGGLASVVITILYYAEIILTRNAPPAEKVVQWQTTLLLAIVYTLIAYIIGWLKQRIDVLIEREADEKKRLQAILEQLPVGVMVTDIHGTTVHSNKQSDVILGMEMDGKTNDEIRPLGVSKYNGSQISPSKWPLSQALTTGKAVVGKEFSLTRTDGKMIHLQISASPIHNHEGEMLAVASIINDITPQKEIDERKDDFVNMASHELKTPITSMKLYLQSLRKRLAQLNDPKAEMTLSRIIYQTDRLQELVSELLDVSRLQTGKLTLNKESFCLNTLINETVEELSAASKNQHLIVESAPKIVVFADRFRLYQVLTNLITNAIKYSPQNSNIHITLKKQTRSATISVQDFGVGIPKAEQKKIFNRLYQVTDPKKKTFAGLGMGLYISKEIVKRHKGRIWVKSSPGKGSTFYVSLPLDNNSKRRKK